MEQSIDGLTKLLNQNNFKNYNPKKKCIIIIFDVNNFKYINDTYKIVTVYRKKALYGSNFLLKWTIIHLRNN